MRYIVSVCLILLAFLAAMHSYADEGAIPYPQDYRQWYHVKSMIIEPGHVLENPFEGIHHIYANKKARKGFEIGKFPDGSMLVFDLLRYKVADHTIVEGDRKLIGVMYKDVDRYGQTGGWNFEGFAGNSHTKRLVSDKGVSCFSCHAAEKNNDYVFSKIRQ